MSAFSLSLLGRVPLLRLVEQGLHDVLPVLMAEAGVALLEDVREVLPVLRVAARGRGVRHRRRGRDLVYGSGNRCRKSDYRCIV